MSAWEYIWQWETLWWLLMVLYIPSCIGLIVIVLLQKGKGTSFAGAFGAGPGSETVFGPRMSKSLPVRLTYVMAATFMVLALVLSLISGRRGRGIAPERITAQEETMEVLEGVGTATDEPAPGLLPGAAPADNALPETRGPASTLGEEAQGAVPDPSTPDATPDTAEDVAEGGTS